LLNPNYTVGGVFGVVFEGCQPQNLKKIPKKHGEENIAKKFTKQLVIL